MQCKHDITSKKTKRQNTYFIPNPKNNHYSARLCYDPKSPTAKQYVTKDKGNMHMQGFCDNPICPTQICRNPCGETNKGIYT